MVALPPGMKLVPEAESRFSDREYFEFCQANPDLRVERTAKGEIVVAPPFTAIHAVAEAARNTNIGVSSQDLYWDREGAFTGEVSPAMVREAELTLLVPAAGSNGAGVIKGKGPLVFVPPRAEAAEAFSPEVAARPKPPAGRVRSSSTVSSGT